MGVFFVSVVCRQRFWGRTDDLSREVLSSVVRRNERDRDASIIMRPWHTSGCCATGEEGGARGDVLLENVNIENNVIEFALERLVAQLILWGLLCDYLEGGGGGG